jgi:regulator of protease activity HflC (stomatin/prohibitin superfamily)
MSASRSFVGLVLVTLAIVVAILAGDSGGIIVVNRELLIFGLLAATALVVQSALAWHSARSQARPVVFVREGVVRRSSGQIAGGDRLRSVSLAVDSGQAVVLERNGLFSRVVGPGTTKLRPGETLYKVVATQPRTLVGTLVCDTRDAITVSVDFEVSAQIMPRSDYGGAVLAPAVGSFPVGAVLAPPSIPRWSEDALVRAAYETHSWESAALSLTRSILREQFAHSYIADFYLPGVSPQETVALESLQSRCRRRLSSSGSVLGISIPRFEITHLGLPLEIAAGSLSVGRARQLADRERLTGILGDAADSRPRTAIRLASVLGGGPFVTFRQAMRARTGDVIVPYVLLEGKRWVGRAWARSDPVPYDLRPDRIHYDVQVHGANFQAAGLRDGEHALFASLPEPADGDIVAVALDGQMELRRYRQKADHVLLEPERESQPLVAVAPNDDLVANLRASYKGSEPPIEVRQAAALKILGRAAIAFQPEAFASRMGFERAAPDVDLLHDSDADADGIPALSPGDDEAGDSG